MGNQLEAASAPSPAAHDPKGSFLVLVEGGFVEIRDNNKKLLMTSAVSCLSPELSRLLHSVLAAGGDETPETQIEEDADTNVNLEVEKESDKDEREETRGPKVEDFDLPVPPPLNEMFHAPPKQERLLGCDNRTIRCDKAFLTLGVSPDVVAEGMKVSVPRVEAARSPMATGNRKTERLLGFSERQIRRDKAMLILGADETDVDADVSKKLGAMGAASYPEASSAESPPKFFNFERGSSSSCSPLTSLANAGRLLSPRYEASVAGPLLQETQRLSLQTFTAVKSVQSTMKLMKAKQAKQDADTVRIFEMQEKQAADTAQMVQMLERLHAKIDSMFNDEASMASL